MLPVSVTAMITDMASKRSIEISPFRTMRSSFPILWAARPRCNAVRWVPSRSAAKSREFEHGHRRDQRWRRDLLQGLGPGAADRLQPRLAAIGRRLGRAIAVLPRQGLPGHRP